MSLKIKLLFEQTSEEQIVLLENKLNYRLPEDYRDFLLQYNGGLPKPNIFFISSSQGESILSILFGISAVEKAYDVWRNTLDAYEFLDRIYVAIGEDPGGNQIFLSLHPEKYGHVFFHDHETSDNMILIAKNFTEFLQSLH